MIIEYPTQEEINASVSDVTCKAYPKRENVFLFLWKLYRRVGFMDVMHGMEKIMLFLAAAYILGTELLMNSDVGLNINIYLLIMMSSPLAFQMLFGLFLIEGVEQGTYEIEMSCQYTTYHLLILRMGTAGLFFVMVNGIFFTCYGLSLNTGIAAALQMAFLSVSMFLLYFALYVWLLLKTVCLQAQLVLYLLWLLGGGFIRFVLPDAFEYMAVRFPLLIHVAIWAAMLIFIAKKIPDFIYTNCRYNLNLE